MDTRTGTACTCRNYPTTRTGDHSCPVHGGSRVINRTGPVIDALLDFETSLTVAETLLNETPHPMHPDSAPREPR